MRNCSFSSRDGEGEGDEVLDEAGTTSVEASVSDCELNKNSQTRKKTFFFWELTRLL